MKTKIAYEEVAKMLNQWYVMIKRHEISQAVSIKHEIEHLLPYMEENQDLLLYFNLLDYRHKLVTEEFAASNRLFEDIQYQKADMQSTDDMIEYYFFFFAGMYEFHKKDYTNAINYYKMAEDKLRKIPDQIENAEFHYKLAIAYYQIKQNFFSLNHAKTALKTFKMHDDYIQKAISNEMLIGANKLDLFRFDEAEQHYKQALKDAELIKHHVLIGMAHHNLGLSYFNRDLLTLAEKHFIEALCLKEHEESVYGIHSMFELTHVLYKAGRFHEAREWFEKGFSRAKKAGEREYLSKFKLIHALYDEQNPLIVEKALEYLKTINLWTDIAELTLDAALFYKKNGDADNAAGYFEESHHARDQILKRTEEIK
ncbi:MULTISPECIES: Rap family tetratricopeptide repeat protein [Bacillus]|uniref:Rap family tetratricopeptide repeat protein n=1 Tax=Bacillus TaxID=1386 RepID=UPI00040B04EB|nr:MULTISPECIES: Rap family tetratricopeptide repeat protein [Bacillus]QHZ45734.1 tetratricopeptide repeat protein [Bacillus sp. NSP9.1]WFA04460.1 tetratricopeptide repeat protein [Bacillus sp. HSf4]